MGPFRLSDRERRILQKLGEAVFPETSVLPHFQAREVEERLARFFDASESMSEIAVGCRAMLNLVEEEARLHYLRPLSKLPEK